VETGLYLLFAVPVKLTITVQSTIQSTIPTIKMGDGTTSSKNQLPDGIKLRGEENYVAWKEAIKDIAVANGLQCFIYKKGKAPKYVNKFDKKANKAKVAK